MGLPKKIKKYIPLENGVSPLERRHQLADMIAEHGTFLPKGLLHADLDKGFLEFVKDNMTISIEGKKISVVDILITTQNWAQFTETWEFQNIDKNAEPPFVTVVRQPEVKFGDPQLKYNIPNKRLYHYAQVPTWDGQRHGMDIYKIPQPVPIQINYTVVIICNRMRELNEFNKTIMELFASRQAYQKIKGHYIPIVMGDIADESVLDLEKRKYYIQKYPMTLQGFLLDEDEFVVQPAIVRTMQIYETDTSIKKQKPKKNQELPTNLTFPFKVGVNTFSDKIFFTSDMTVAEVDNISTYSVYINDDFYGNDISEIQINTNDILKIDVTKNDGTKNAKLVLQQKLI
jgi:hypothetical protein